MIQSIIQMLTSWNVVHSERTKLQHTYVAVAVAGIILAGLVGLLNRDVSQIIVGISLISLGIGLANTLVWALLYSLVVVKLEKPAKNNRK